MDTYGRFKKRTTSTMARKCLGDDGGSGLLPGAASARRRFSGGGAAPPSPAATNSSLLGAIGSLPPSLAGSALSSGPGRRRVGGEGKWKSRGAQQILYYGNSASNQPGVRQWLLGTGYCCRYNWLGLARVRGAKTETLERKVDKKGISNVLFFL